MQRRCQALVAPRKSNCYSLESPIISWPLEAALWLDLSSEGSYTHVLPVALLVVPAYVVVWTEAKHGPLCILTDRTILLWTGLKSMILKEQSLELRVKGHERGLLILR